MKYAVTVTTNNKKVNTDENIFRLDFLRFMQFELNIDVRDLEFTIEYAKTMGYHAHGIVNSYYPNIKGYKFFIYSKKLEDDDDITKWRHYMNKDTYIPAFLLDE